VENESNREQDRNNGFYSKKLRAGKRRTYFFDVRSTKGSDYYLTITESKKRSNGNGYDSHKVFLYKEDFKKFIEGLEDTIKHIKTELMPGFDFDNFTRETYFENRENDEPREYRDNREPRESSRIEKDPILRELAAAKPAPARPDNQKTSNTDDAGQLPQENVDAW
jgi:hypothetical protein